MMAGHAMIERVVGPRSKFGLMSVITRALGGAWELLTSRMAMFAYLPAIYFVWRISDGFGRAGVVHIDWMWLGEVKGAAEYLTRNFGAWLLVPAITALALWHRGTEECRRLRLEFVLHSGLFILFFNVMLAPWAWDNVKVLIWPYLGFSRIAWISTERLLSSLLGRFLRLFLALFLFFSGYYAVKYSLLNERRGVKIYSASDLALTEGALAQVPLNSVFAASPTHNHSLSWFGRLRVVGYEGHLHSHGIDYRSTLAKHERIMRGDPQWLALCRELGVTHIFWGQEERSRYGDGPRPWMDALPNVSRVPSTAIFYIAN
jgi:hypothetical protein